jgi:hypothetical protein
MSTDGIIFVVDDDKVASRTSVRRERLTTTQIITARPLAKAKSAGTIPPV